MRILNVLTRKIQVAAVVSVALLVAFAACRKDPTERPTMLPERSYAVLTSGNTLLYFNGVSPSNPLGTTTLSGLQSGEWIISIDFRPATGQLYGLSNQSRLYVINPDDGKSWQVGTEAFTPTLASMGASIDFNPTVDRIRLVTDNGQNLRLHPETGAVVAEDGNISGVPGVSISGVAYTNSKAGATSTTLFDIDMTTKSLYKQDPPNEGGLMLVGALGVDFSGVSAFDISPNNDMAITVLKTTAGSRLHSVDLNSGKAEFVASIGGDVLGLAIWTDPVAYAADESNNLIIFNPLTPTDRVTTSATGIEDGDKIVGLDFRPANNQLYALGSKGRIYTVNTANATFTAVGSAFLTELVGSNFGFDFNPTVDRIRLVSDVGQNLRLNPNDGTVAAVDGMLNPGSPKISAAAYTNNVADATSTTLFVIDGAGGKLYKQDPPNDGVLVEVGNLGAMFSGSDGFDIGARSGMAFALLTSGGNASAVYTINLQTGMATKVSDFSGTVSAMTVGPGW